MELQIQKFLRNGGTLKELNQMYEIEFNTEEREGIVVFNYRNIADMNEPMVREARGLILELGTWNIVNKSLDAFFSTKEPQSESVLQKMNWSTAKAMEKLDGALLCMYYYKDQWRVSTRLSAIGNWLVWSQNSQPHSISWENYTKLALQDMGTTWEEFTSKLDKDIFYSFEIVGPENRVICVYTERKLYLIGAIKRDTLEEIDIYSMDFPVLKPSYVSVSSVEDTWQKVLGQSEPYTHEGVVVIDDQFNRVKFVDPAYFDLLYQYSIKDDFNALRQLRASIMTQTSVFSTGCVPLDLKVENENGQEQAIGSLKVGDKILSRNKRVQIVTEIKDIPDQELLKITHEAGVFYCTVLHPLFNDKQSITSAINLTKNDCLLLPDEGLSKVIDVEKTSIKTMVRSIEVTPDHEFILEKIISHNLTCKAAAQSTPNNIYQKLTSMMRLVQDEYVQDHSGSNAISKKIWPEAWLALQNGKSIAQAMDMMPEDTLLKALAEYDSYVATQGINA